MKIRIKSKKNLVILSDILPYEVPVTFSNHYFYKFLDSNEIEFNGENITWKRNSGTLDEIVKLVFGIDKEIETSNEVSKFKDFDKRLLLSIPFGYSISHKENSFRELTVCHPRSQIQVVNFYKKYKEIILYYCGISPFSIRKPNSIAKCIIHKDKSFYKAFSNEIDTIEESGREYEHLRSFFVYKSYSNIHKFYESPLYHECEKKYNKLLKLDISRCFDSIYTHSIAWAIIGKDSVKDALATGKHKILSKTFSGSFDTLMQQLNYNETNGIVIGPEFSRIFAELILQSVDREVFLLLKNKYTLEQGIDYEIYRYVDDYFIFYNDKYHKKLIHEELQFSLQKYKLYLNSSKETVYEKPLITEISIAKNKLVSLFRDRLRYKIDKLETQDEQGENIVIKRGTININPRILITEFKIIIKESNVQYKDIMNYALAVVERKCANIIRDYCDIEKKVSTENYFVKAVSDVIEFVFFIYSVSPRVNTTIKLCRILNLFIAFFKTKKINSDFQHIVFKNIYDNICFLLKKNKSTKHTQVETLYLLVILQELGREYWLDASLLRSYFNISDDNNLKMELNYFSVTVLLFYMKNKVRYKSIREAIEAHIILRFNKHKKTLRKDTEFTMLLLDTLSCPYITKDTKYELLKMYGVTNQQTQDSVINFSPVWFTNWSEFNFKKELDSKRMQEVY